MHALILQPLHLGLALLAVWGNPHLLVRNLMPSSDRISTLGRTAAISALLNIVIPLLLHIRGIPIRPDTLALLHLPLGVVLTALLFIRRIRIMPPVLSEDRVQHLMLMMAFFTAIVLPFTHLAGIDTYKWQDVATLVQVEERIPWLVHPVSLFGYGPRSYPVAQPLLLATIQSLGALGVDWGFFLMSAFSGLAAVSLSYLLGKSIFRDPRLAAWMAFLYVFSPIFMRYNHWATGRGLFLALLPGFLWALLQLPKKGAWFDFLLLGILLPLCHKTGIVALVLAGISLLLIPLSTRLLSHRATVLGLLAATLLAGIAFSSPFLLGGPAGHVAGFFRADVTRFAILTPLALFSLTAPALLLPAWQRLLPMALAAYALAHSADMYGALIALPFVALAATGGTSALVKHLPEHARLIRRILILLPAATCLCVVGHRSATATPSRIYTTAQFIQSLDPQGPLVVHAPGRATRQIQAYLSGCPRFTMEQRETAPTPSPQIPKIAGVPLQTAILDWTAYLRNVATPRDVEIDWYGTSPRHYYITVDGKGETPANGTLLHSADGVQLLVPQGQSIPKD